MNLWKTKQPKSCEKLLVYPNFTYIFSYNLWDILKHKVHRLVGTTVCIPASELGLSHPLSRQRVCPSPQNQRGGGTTACGWGVGGVPIPTTWEKLSNLPTLCLAGTLCLKSPSLITFCTYNWSFSVSRWYFKIWRIPLHMRWDFFEISPIKFDTFQWYF